MNGLRDRMTLSLAPDAFADTCPAVAPPAIAMLRVLAPACRAQARIDMFRACAMLSQDPMAAGQAYGEALLRVLAQALGRMPVLHRAGSAEMSFDESWLAALFAAHARGDADSVTFLIRRRIAPVAVRHVGFLIAALADRMAEADRSG
jgi:hypothetical protein